MTTGPSNSDAVENTPLVVALISIAKAVRQLTLIKLAKCGVLPGQDQYLLCFGPNEGVPVVTIADRLSVRASTVSKMTDILERKGWVVRETDHDDARRVLVRLTKAGLAVREDVRLVEAAMEEELSAALGEDDRMLSCLAKLDAVLVQRLSRYR